MPEGPSREFPLFPLGMVALPGELIPLHIFEERYKTMIDECIGAEREFGIVWLSDDGLREVGCACAIDQVLERMDDGRMHLIVRGTRPFRVLERQGHLPYPAGVIEFVEDRHDEVDAELAKGRWPWRSSTRNGRVPRTISFILPSSIRSSTWSIAHAQPTSRRPSSDNHTIPNSRLCPMHSSIIVL